MLLFRFLSRPLFFFLSACSHTYSRNVVVSTRIYDASCSNLLLEASFPQSLQTDGTSTYNHSQIIMRNAQLKERRKIKKRVEKNYLSYSFAVTLYRHRERIPVADRL
jgi:hypothetical protein